MNTVWIIMPILMVLMFLMGTNIKNESFKILLSNPLPIVIGLIGQIVILPIIAIIIGRCIKLPPVYFMGVLLIACCPGGSSSNVFTLLANGNIALSVLLTTFSSLITIVTLPIIVNSMSLKMIGVIVMNVAMIGKKIFVQNILLLLLPMLLGYVFRVFFSQKALLATKILEKIAMPSLMIVVMIFIFQHIEVIVANFTEVGTAILALIIAALIFSSILSRVCRFSSSTRRTIVIEVGMQNAALAITLATSPFIFNNYEMAIPAIIYTLLMNVILLLYVYITKYKFVVNK